PCPASWSIPACAVTIWPWPPSRCGTGRGSSASGTWPRRARFEPIALPGLPTCVAARPGSGQLAVICSSGELLVADDRTGKTLLELRHEGWAASDLFAKSVQVQYTPDGKTLVSLGGGTASEVGVRDADSGRMRFPALHPH